jgi:hypothetical protein
MPPADIFFFPSSAVMAPGGQWLFVANSNADLRYNDGTLAMVDVQAAAADRARPGAWAACPQQDYVTPLSRSLPPTCCWDALDSNILNCDERLYVQADATVRIGSFAAGMVWQPYCTGACSAGCPFDPAGARIILGVRGDTSLTYVDVVPDAAGGRPTLHCRDDGADAPLAECTQKVVDTAPFLTSEQADSSLPRIQLPDEPYALTLDKDRNLLYVGHLVGNTSVADSGGISVFDVSPKAESKAVAGFPPQPDFIAPFPSPFPASSTGGYGITSLSMHAPLGSDPAGSKEILVSSRYLPEVTSMVPFLSGNSTAASFNCGPNSDVVLLGAGDTLNTGLVGTETRGVAIVDPPPAAPDEPQRVFALQRVPPDLVEFDVARNQSGALTLRPSNVIETCSSPTFLYQHDAGDGMRLYVNCFDTGEIYVFDPYVPALISSFQVGRGPGGMVFDPTLPVAYVLDFSQNDLVVVDLQPGSPTEDHVIQRLGFPSTSPR